MRSFKYIAVLVSNACFLIFLRTVLADPVEKWLMPYHLVSTAVDVAYLTIFAAFLIVVWVAVKHFMHWELRLGTTVGVAIALTLGVTGNAYYQCIHEWQSRDPRPDRKALIQKLYRYDYSFTGTDLNHEEYSFLARKYRWRAIPTAAYRIYLESNGGSLDEEYPAKLNFLVPKGTPIKRLADELDDPPTLSQEIEDLGDSVAVRYSHSWDY